MKFLLNKNDKEQLNKLFETREYNINVNEYLNENVINNSLTDEDKNEYDIKLLDITSYINNEYYKNVLVDEVKSKTLNLRYNKYNPNTSFLYDEALIDENDYYLTKNRLGYFLKEYTYLSLDKNDITWMSIIPHEINTMNNDINIAKGDVYIFGLGLGYFAYQVANKKEVKDITIVDYDSELLGFFIKNIFDKFNNKEKYRFVNEDAYSFIKTINKDDFVFVDLWHNEVDGLPMYIKFKKLFKGYNNVHYWIEDSIINALRNLLIILIEEEFYRVNADYINSNNDDERIINSLHTYLLDKEFRSYNEIKEFLSTKNLKEIVINLSID